MASRLASPGINLVLAQLRYQNWTKNADRMQAKYGQKWTRIWNIFLAWWVLSIAVHFHPGSLTLTETINATGPPSSRGRARPPSTRWLHTRTRTASTGPASSNRATRSSSRRPQKMYWLSRIDWLLGSIKEVFGELERPTISLLGQSAFVRSLRQLVRKSMPAFIRTLPCRSRRIRWIGFGLNHIADGSRSASRLPKCRIQ